MLTVVVELAQHVAQCISDCRGEQARSAVERISFTYLCARQWTSASFSEAR